MLRKVIRKLKLNQNRKNSLYQKYKDYTMIDEVLFNQNIKTVYDHFKNQTVSGIAVECGVWRGGMIAAIAETLGNNWEYHLFDSFEGLPPAREIDGIAAKTWQADKNSNIYYDNCTAEVSFAKEAMNLAKIKPVIHKGWFEDSIPEFSPKKNISLLRLDGDWYDSTMTCLQLLYPHLEENGLILIDDYFAWDGCSKAVHDYLSSIKSNSRLRTDGYLCYIIKTENGRPNSI